MLRRRKVFDGLAADFASTTLLGSAPSPAIARIDAGESWVRL
jgi:hypothetical protein